MESTETFIYKLHKRFDKCVSDYALINEGDKILIGLSGGKDSLALVEFLGRKQRIFKPRFTAVAVHITMENIPYASDLDYLKNYCESWGIEFYHKSTCFNPDTDKRKNPCFLCSWNRRKVLFETAKELNCNKIALGHHQDDVLATLLMNMNFQGTISTMPPLLKMNKFEMEIIRPMSLIREADLIKLAEIRSFKKQNKNCPYEHDSHRSDIAEILRKLEEINPHSKDSLWGSMTNIQTEYLPAKKEN